MTSYDLTQEELAEWGRRTDPKRDHLEGLEDALWRLTNLYMCLDPDGTAVHFVPTPEQKIVIWSIEVRQWRRLIIPKARQLGMSLVLCLMGIDRTVFRAGFSGALIDKTQDDASKKMREKIKFAWNNLPPDIRDGLKVSRENDGELTLTSKGIQFNDNSPSSYQVGVNYRGGTVEWLHISEWGAIQDDDRARSREIKAGAVPAVERAENGVLVIETTWKGGLDGELGPYVHEAMSTPEEEKGLKSWRILFFGWFTEPSYRQTHGSIDSVSEAYFREVEAKGVVLSHEQKLWYAEKRRTASSAKTIKEEYPTLVHECWENLPQGSIYGKWIEEARSEGRISDFTAPKDYPVHTVWDIGMPINTVCWLFQITPYQIRIVDVLQEAEMTMEERGEWLRKLPWNYGNHYFPHDADTDSASIGIKPIDQFRRVLGPNCRVVPRCHSVYDGIGLLRANFRRLFFACDPNSKDLDTSQGRMKRGLEYLSRYREARESSTGITRSEPVHDRYSHGGSAMNQLGLILGGGLVEHANHIGDKRGESTPRKLSVIRAGTNW